MKKSVKEIIEETFKYKCDWNYYAASCEEFNCNPMQSDEDAKKFLEKFIVLSGKTKNRLFCNINKLCNRARHVVSAFFIGHYIYKKSLLKCKIDKEIANLKEKAKVKSDVNFSFIWFMTCLFHDLGYTYESESNPKYSDFESLERKFNNLDNKVDGVPELYANVYKNYFDFRLKKHNKNDHGIVGSHIFYSELSEIRKLADKNSQSKLCWEEELLAIYNFCAWNILGHNIWFVKPNDKNYNHYENMPDLKLSENEYKISIDKHPFFFLFCLVDTIEPYKKVLDYETLRRVSLDIKKDKIIISTSMKCSCGQSIIKQAKSLNNWLTTTKEVNNTVEIYFTPQNM